MDALRIQGGGALKGDIKVSGSKNATLPIMAATLLCEGTCVIEGVPQLADVRTFAKVLASMGASVDFEGDTLRINTRAVSRPEALYELVRTMRASILVLGPLLARFGEAKVSLPGGCAIGARPIDQHLKGFERLGAHFELEHGYVLGRVDTFRGGALSFDMPTVGGTENLMLAAALTDGETIIGNAAREPEIEDLAAVLRKIGATVEGDGTATIKIRGTTSPQPFEHRVVADRIEFGTFVVAGAMAGEDLRIEGGVPAHQRMLIDKLKEAGAQIQEEGEHLRIRRPSGGDRLAPLRISTAPYPGFPTDMQAQLMAAMTLAEGTSEISENIFENRFMHVAELDRMGAEIRVEGGKAIIRGAEALSGATVMATDLRASACLVLAGLVAEGETVVRRIYHLDRGYESIGSKLNAVGARISRFREDG